MIANQIDDSGPVCPSCGYEMDWEDCSDCGGDGWYDAYDLDPMWYEPDEQKMCDMCDGKGGWYFCTTRACPVVRRAS